MLLKGTKVSFAKPSGAITWLPSDIREPLIDPEGVLFEFWGRDFVTTLNAEGNICYFDTKGELCWQVRFPDSEKIALVNCQNEVVWQHINNFNWRR